MTDEQFIHATYVELGIRPARQVLSRTYTLDSISPVRLHWQSSLLGDGWDYRTEWEAANFIRCYMLDQLAKEKLTIARRDAFEICFDRAALLQFWKERFA